MALLAIIVWFGVCLQFYISTALYLSQGRTFGGAIVQLFSYYTIQNNILVALALTLILLKPASAWGKFFSKPTTLTAIAVYITIVGLVYQLVLSKQHHYQGLFVLTDSILHAVCPILYILFWLIFVPKDTLKWKDGLNWLIYPLVYLIYILIRGAISGLYPYSFIDANKLSYQQIAINSIFLMLAFLSVGAAYIAIGQLLKKE